MAQALVHSSYANENPSLVVGHNERLEFLGDAVLGVIVSEFLFAFLPTEDEGALTARRAALVNRDALAAVAREIGLNDLILLGRGETDAGGADRPSVLAGAFEAVVAGLYLEDGMIETTRVLTPILRQRASAVAGISEPPKSAKSRLQEWSQRERHGKPAYQVRQAIGPAHDQRFTVEVVVDGRVLASGTGSSRQRAEEQAATTALGLVASQ